MPLSASEAYNEARNVIQNELDSLCPSNTHTGDPNFNPQDQGRFSGRTPPPTTVEFLKRIEDSVVSWQPNGWSLEKLDKIALIQDAMKIYKQDYYSGWVNLPLDADAPPEVVAWQVMARATGV